MNENSAFLRLFDKLLLVAALVAAVAVLYLAFQKPANILDNATLDSYVKKVESNRVSKQTVDLGHTFSDHTSIFVAELSERGTPKAGSSWMYYPQPTPREFNKVTITPPPPIQPEISPVASLSVVSMPGQVQLKWAAPLVQRDIVISGYYVFRESDHGNYGVFVLDEKLRVRLGDSETLNKPIAGPLKTLEHFDTEVHPEKAYAYLVVAVGLPARPVLRDGKPVVGVDGAPLMEIISDVPVASVSSAVEGITVPEVVIFLRGIVNGVAANFDVFQWDRANSKWAQGKALSVAVGKKIAATTKDKQTLDTGWVLHSLETSDKARNLDTAVIVLEADYAVRRKLLITNQREPDGAKVQFAPVLDEADAKKP